VQIKAPFVGMSKTKIVNNGLIMAVPFDMTRTCYKDQPVACGVCGSCLERLEAFQLNGAKDPLRYEEDD